MPPLGAPLLPPAPWAGWGCPPPPGKRGRQAHRGIPPGGCDSQPSRRCSGATCWVPAPPLHQPQATVSTRLAPAADAKGFCFVACRQRRALSRSTVVPGMSLLPGQPDFIHSSLPSLSRSDGQGSQHGPKTAQTHCDRHAFLFLIHSVLD